ncbi:UDP-N-acetyl-D-glucosamine 6-dehydrogenase [hydrothermal vent metagenome]|uniref:UDP-N-acetyl-D-glucosamine 6-dehydrogenase n=1 Tax=hydrothermal vent metagenome TaxID=652676 RepID=A0A3B0XV60_9ZZZZ
MHTTKETRVGIIGLGYVGLPLAVEFSKHFTTVGFDINSERINELKNDTDRTLEVEPEILQQSTLTFSGSISDLSHCNVYIVTVPTPVDENKNPDLTPLCSATQAIGTLLNKDDIVIYESTVYPGATEDTCVPILEKISKLTFNKDFYVGYSPERINPGDKEHRITSILKVTSGSTPDVAEYVDLIYRTVIIAGTHKASSIKVAEAAKVIENTQRDVNIALINELALLFNKMEIDTLEVLEAAGTKWNFMPFRPGLVGGHCIGVDPYYLTHKAQAIGFHPRIILAGREINDGMGAYVAETVIKLMTRKRITVVDSRILILGLAFKENCPDLRNTRVIDIIDEFDSYHAKIDVYDPWIDKQEAKQEYGFDLVDSPNQNEYDAIVLAVPHQEFLDLATKQLRAFGKENCIIYDVKSILPRSLVDARL